MAGGRALAVMREWTEDCRVHDHGECRHIGAARTIGFLGVRRFVTVCSCPCHWGCPAETVDLAESAGACTCSGNGPARQRFFDTAARSSEARRSPRRDR